MSENKAYKRFMVFACEQHYPGGGLDDCDNSFDSLEQAKAFVEEKE